jgi:hypothetical protein
MKKATPNGLTPQGDAWLTQVEAAGGTNAAAARQARAIIAGQEPMPEGKPGEGGLGAVAKDMVLKAAPGFDARLAATRVNMAKEYMEQHGNTAGGQILALNSAFHHLGLLIDHSERIANSGSPILNSVGNLVSRGLLGNPALQGYKTNQDALAAEIEKFYQGGVPGQDQVKSMVENLSPNMTRAEQHEVFQTVADLLQGKASALQTGWKNAFGQQSSFPVLHEEGQQVIHRLGGGGGGEAAPAAVPSLGVGETHKVGDVTIRRVN